MRKAFAGAIVLVLALVIMTVLVGDSFHPSTREENPPMNQ
ncbi:protein of unknown function [Thermococcus camini]|uniref:Uncharacterized protein n=1 Tax=Thermococcus camini TaxID=2016373 RepID=A0A7G2D5G2_9EURY|nr:protein of unknown function [Thermococcus camini]